MEGNNLPSGSLMQGTPYGSLDLHHNHMPMHAPNSGNQGFNHPQMASNFPIHLNQVTDSDQLSEFQFGEHGKANHHHHHHDHHHQQQTKNSMSDDEEHDMTEDATYTPSSNGKKGSPWHRVKWTDTMVKLLITAVSYIGDDHGPDLGGGRRNFTIM